MLLGFDPEARHPLVELTLQAGDHLLLATDGVFDERQGDPRPVWDRAGVRECVARFPNLGWRKNLEYLFASFSGNETLRPLKDDVSMILIDILERDAPPQEARQTLFP